MGHFLSELTNGHSIDELQHSACEAEYDFKKKEEDTVRRLTPLVAAYLEAKQCPCTIPEIEDALQPLGIDTFHVRDAVSHLVNMGDATLSLKRDIQAKRASSETPQENRRALEAILLQRVSTSLVAAGEKLLLCHKYHHVAEIVDLLEEIGDGGGAAQLRLPLTLALSRHSASSSWPRGGEREV